jgi:hypothetical protein
MFGKGRLKKIIAMLNDLTDEELDELIAVAEDAKDGDSEEEIEKDKVETETETEVEEPDGDEEKVEEKTEVEEETKTEEEIPEAEEIPEEETEEEEAEEEAHEEVDGEILTSIKAIKETIEAITARMAALEAAKTEERNDFEFGLEGKDGVTEEKKDSLEELKKKYWNI